MSEFMAGQWAGPAPEVAEWTLERRMAEHANLKDETEFRLVPDETRMLLRKIDRNHALAVERDAALARLAEIESADTVASDLERAGERDALSLALRRIEDLERKDELRQVQFANIAQVMNEMAERCTRIENAVPRARTGKPRREKKSNPVRRNTKGR